MKPEVRRQVVLAGLLVAAVLAYVRFGMGGPADGGERAAATAGLPAIDVAGLAHAMETVKTIDPAIGRPRDDSSPDRDLFQYEAKRPQPPSPDQLAAGEARRKAAEAQLALQEQQLREQKERDRAAEEQRRQTEQLALQNPPATADQPPPEPANPAPPAINLRLMGMMGPSDRKLGVFQDGDKVLMARQGDVLLGRFRVLSLGVEGAEIGYVDPAHKDRAKRLSLGQ